MQASTDSTYPNRWWILASVMAVMIMAPLDASAVNIIIPVIQQEFHVPLEHLGQIAWVPLAYLIVIGGFILPMGRFGDLWGFRRLFLTGVVLFTASSAMCGFSQSLPWLICARLAQGVGACMMMALSPGITTAIFPANERGRALGVMGMGIAIGLVIGPSFGGFLAHWINWRAVFYINVPIGLLGGLWCTRLLPPLHPVVKARADWRGGILAVLLLCALLLALTHGEAWGWLSPQVLSLAAATAILALLFARHEKNSPAPMLDFSLFRNRVFVGANIASMMNYLGQSCAIFLTPILLERGLDCNTQQAGLVLAVVPLAVIILAPISGALSDRIGTRGLAIAGESIVAAGLAGQAVLLHLLATGQVARDHALPLIIPLLALIGIGTALFQPPNNSAIMGSVPRTHLGIGGAFLATMRTLGMAFGTALSSAVAVVGMRHLASGGPEITHSDLFRGVSTGFAVAAFFVLLGALATLLRQEHDRSPQTLPGTTPRQ